MREFINPGDIEKFDEGQEAIPPDNLEEEIELPGGTYTFGEEPGLGSIGAILKAKAELEQESNAVKLFHDLQVGRKTDLEASLQQLGSEMQDTTLYHPNRRNVAINEIRERWHRDFEYLAYLEHLDRVGALNKLVYGLKIPEGRVSATQRRFMYVQNKTTPRAPLLVYMDGIQSKLMFSNASFALMGYVLDLFDHPTPYTLSLQSYLARENVREGLLDDGPYGKEVKLPKLLEAFSHWIEESK